MNTEQRDWYPYVCFRKSFLIIVVYEMETRYIWTKSNCVLKGTESYLVFWVPLQPFQLVERKCANLHLLPYSTVTSSFKGQQPYV